MKPCGNKRRYLVQLAPSHGYLPHGDFPVGGDTVDYEERAAHCTLQFGHPGRHFAMVEGKPTEWKNPYDG